VVLEIAGVVKLSPVARIPPPVEVAYQQTVPPILAEADKLKVPASHLLELSTPAILGVTLTVAVTLVLVALVQLAVAASAK